MSRFALLERLKAVQKMPKYQGRDITTISAILSNQALAKHVEVCEQAAGISPQVPLVSCSSTPAHIRKHGAAENAGSRESGFHT